MNYRIILKSLGILLICEAVAMAFALAVSMYYREGESRAFLYSLLIIIIIGVPLSFIKKGTNSFFLRDGFAIVGIGWVAVSVLGSLPFYFSGTIPGFVDSLFETVSGFSTTGASILTEIESLPKGMLFWRSMTHWIGGMGVLMLALAILPMGKAGAFHVMKAEAPGPDPGKLVPKISNTIKILYGIYLLLTVSQTIFLMISGLSLYDALIHAFGTAGTGGFSNRNLSVGAYNNLGVEIITIFFMFAFGTNFALHYQALKGNFKSYVKNDEFKFYLGIAMATILLLVANTYGRVFESLGDAFRYSSFQVVSLLTTTGYVTHDFNEWTVFARMLLLGLMFVGGCSGSTGGSIKVVRILLLFRVVKRKIVDIKHPRAVIPVKIGGKIVSDEILTSVLAFFFLFIFIFTVGVLIVSLEGKDIVTTITAVAASIGNIGPGLGMVGATGNYAEFSDLSKITLSICMIVGRLEIYPILLLVFPSFWKKANT